MNYSMVSAIILSGGKSSRMGTDKCDLEYQGNTLLNFQISKLRSIGLVDIIASGYRGNKCDAKVILDDISKGPLSGILVGLENIVNDRAFVISVDVPLVRKDTIRKLIELSFEKDVDIIILSHKRRNEPLIGVYKKTVIDILKKILREDKYSVMRLIDKVTSEIVEIEEDDSYFLNINYKEDYNMLNNIKSL